MAVMETMRRPLLQNEAEYDAAVAEVERLFGAEPGSAEATRFFMLASLVEAYEQQHHAIEPPTDHAAALYALEKRTSAVTS